MIFTSIHFLILTFITIISATPRLPTSIPNVQRHVSYASHSLEPSKYSNPSLISKPTKLSNLATVLSRSPQSNPSDEAETPRASPTDNRVVLDTSDVIALGVGLGVGIPAVLLALIGIIIAWKARSEQKQASMRAEEQRLSVIRAEKRQKKKHD